MTSKKVKAGLITLISTGAAFLMLEQADQYLNGSRGKAWFMNEVLKRKPVDIAEAKAWLRRTPLVENPADADQLVDEVVDEGLKQGWWRRHARDKDK